jgi:enolase-phosphatase E1
VAEVRRRLAAEHAADVAHGESPPPWSDTAASLASYALWLMDRDRKSPGLKLLQGQIWEEGYRAGVLRGQVYDDVSKALRRWRDAGLDVAIYSSGSELAQRRLFESTDAGDLTPLIGGYFDTAVGAKNEPESYTRIAAALKRLPSQILFVSDVVAELNAARRAGLHGALSTRPGNPPQPPNEFEAIQDFDEIG